MWVEDNIVVVLVCFEIFNEVSDYKKEKECCKDLEVIGNVLEFCGLVDECLVVVEECLVEFDCNI